MPHYVVQATVRALERNGTPVQNANVLVLGLAYKRDVDDLRESPALTIIETLQQLGAKVEYNDPFFPTVRSGRKYDLQLESTPLEDLDRFDCVLIVTDHTVYNYGEIVAQSKLVVDSRNSTRAIDSPKIVRC